MLNSGGVTKSKASNRPLLVFLILFIILNIFISFLLFDFLSPRLLNFNFFYAAANVQSLTAFLLFLYDKTFLNYNNNYFSSDKNKNNSINSTSNNNNTNGSSNNNTNNNNNSMLFNLLELFSGFLYGLDLLCKFYFIQHAGPLRYCLLLMVVRLLSSLFVNLKLKGFSFIKLMVWIYKSKNGLKGLLFFVLTFLALTTQNSAPRLHGPGQHVNALLSETGGSIAVSQESVKVKGLDTSFSNPLVTGSLDQSECILFYDLSFPLGPFSLYHSLSNCFILSWPLIITCLIIFFVNQSFILLNNLKVVQDSHNSLTNSKTSNINNNNGFMSNGIATSHWNNHNNYFNYFFLTQKLSTRIQSFAALFLFGFIFLNKLLISLGIGLGFGLNVGMEAGPPDVNTFISFNFTLDFGLFKYIWICLFFSLFWICMNCPRESLLNQINFNKTFFANSNGGSLLELFIIVFFGTLIDLYRGDGQTHIMTCIAACTLSISYFYFDFTNLDNKRSTSLSNALSINSNSNLGDNEDKGFTSNNNAVHGLSSLSNAEFRRKLKLFMQDKTSVRILMFLTINFIFMFVELIYGYFSNSLGLISDAGHMLFDCTALAIGLYASFVSKIGPNSTYTYGYNRYEIISGYVNGVFLLFIGYFIFVESIERLFKPPEITSESLVLVSALGFGVNMIGLIFFHDHGGHGHSHGPGGHGGHGAHGHGAHGANPSSEASDHGGHGAHGAHGGHGAHGHGVTNDSESCSHGHEHGSEGPKDSSSHDHGHGQTCPSESKKSNNTVSKPSSQNHNIDGIFLHILADTLGSVGVIISSLLVEHFGWTSADAICSIIISVLIVLSVIPLIKSTAYILMNRTPENILDSIDDISDSISKVSGVSHVERLNFWQFTESVIVASVLVHTVTHHTQPSSKTKSSKLISHNGSDDLVSNGSGSDPWPSENIVNDLQLKEAITSILKQFNCNNITIHIQYNSAQFYGNSPNRIESHIINLQQ